MPKYSAQNVTKLLLEQLAATNVLVKNVLNNTKQEVTMTKPDGNHVGCALQAVSDPLAGSLGAILRENGKRGEERREDEKSEEVLLGGKAECAEASEVRWPGPTKPIKSRNIPGDPKFRTYINAGVGLFEREEPPPSLIRRWFHMISLSGSVTERMRTKILRDKMNCTV